MLAHSCNNCGKNPDAFPMIRRGTRFCSEACEEEHAELQRRPTPDFMWDDDDL